jgi:hypothetical protein
MVSRQSWRLCGITAPSATELLLKMAQRIVEISEEHIWMRNEELAALSGEVQKAGTVYHAAIIRERDRIASNIAGRSEEEVKGEWEAAMESPDVKQAKAASLKASSDYEAALQRQRTPGWRYKSLLRKWPAIRADLVKLKWANKDRLDRCRGEAEWEFHQAQRYCAEQEQGRSINHQQSESKVTPKQQKAIKDRKTEARDKWMYDQAKKGNKTYRQIMLDLAKVAQSKGWRKLDSPQAIEQAIGRYIKRNDLAALPPRKER